MLPVLRSRTRGHADRTSVAGELRAQQRVWWRLYGQALLATLLFGVFALVWAPHPAPATLAFYAVLITATFIRPVVGVYAVTLLTLIGDSAVAGWYPFAKNFSSRESISYVSDALTITPIDLMLGITVLAWLLKSYATNTWRFRRGALGWPMLLFGAFVVIGLGRAFVGAGDPRIAVFEGRAMVYLPVLYLLIVQLFETRRQYVTLFVVTVVGLFLHALLALESYLRLADDVRSDLQRLTEHSASVHIAALLVTTMAAWLIPGCSRGLRVLLLVAAVPALIEFGLSQRRSGAIALAIGGVLLLIVLWRLRPRILPILVPVMVLGLAGYLVAFWNTTGAIGFGAQAFKSVFAADQLDQSDANSNLYREIEAFDIWFTIRAAPLTGVGFGNPFYQPWPLPFLAGFEFRHFIPHNNFLWVWLKLGIGGFVAMLFLIARTVQYGARSVIRLARGDHAALMMGAVAYVIMYVVFSYVDIAWDARSMVFLAVAAAWCGDFLGAGPATDGESDAHVHTHIDSRSQESHA